jgi:lipid-A-disaccharide synthase
MQQLKFFLIAGETSGDILGAKLIESFKQHPSLEQYNLKFAGAGGKLMREKGLLEFFDMTEHAVVGAWEVLKHYSELKKIFNALIQHVIEEKPDVIILIDFPGFNLRFLKAIRKQISKIKNNTVWKPKFVYYVSPQLWAWHESRFKLLEKHLDLLICIFPFEKSWYSLRAPKLKVEFVGHPIFDRYDLNSICYEKNLERDNQPTVLLLPGSRDKEVQNHIPLLAETAKLLARQLKCNFKVVLTKEQHIEQAKKFMADIPNLTLLLNEIEIALKNGCLAIAASGTVTIECAVFGVPTIVFYKTSLITYLIGKKLIKVPYLSMPNILIGDEVFPEFIQYNATPENLAQAAFKILTDSQKSFKIKTQLKKVKNMLGEKGASFRAADSIVKLLIN